MCVYVCVCACMLVCKYLYVHVYSTHSRNVCATYALLKYAQPYIYAHVFNIVFIYVVCDKMLASLLLCSFTAFRVV